MRRFHTQCRGSSLFRFRTTKLPLFVLVWTWIALAPPVRAQTPEVSSITGEWHGIFHVYPDFLRIELDLAASSARDLTGEVSIRTMQGQRRNALGGIQGRGRIEGAWDPVARSVHLRTVEWIEDPRRHGYAVELLGVYDVSRNQVAGRVAGSGGANSPFFILARPDRADERIFKEARDAADAEHVRPLGGGGLLGKIGDILDGSEEDDDKLADWAGQLPAEFPDLDLRHTTIGNIYDRARSIFADEYFEPFFGKSFDEMGDRERSSIRRRLREMSAEEHEMADAFGVLHYGFGATGTTSVMDITLSVMAQRVVRAWRNDLLRRMEDWSAEDIALEDIRQLQDLAEGQIALLWPSEQLEFREVYGDARARIALPLLIESRDEMLASAEGVEGIHAIDAWRERNEEVLGWISKEDRSRLEAPLDNRRGELQADVAEEVKGSLDQIPSDASGLALASKWYRAFRAISPELDPEESIRLESEFTALRTQQLQDFAPTLTRLVHEAGSHSELRTALDPSMLLESDWSHSSMTPVAEAVVQKHEFLDRLSVLGTTEEALFADRDRSARLQEPTEEEMYLAVRRRLGIANTLFSLADRNCKEQGGRTDPASAVVCLVQWLGTGDTEPLQMQITSFSKQGCTPAEGGRGSVCDFRMSLRQNTPLFQSGLGDLVQLIMSAEIVRGHFRESGGGWTYTPVQRE